MEKFIIDNGVLKEYLSQNENDITIPNNVTKIDSSVFKEKGISGQLIIPSSVQSIGDMAFYGNNITNLTLPSHIKISTTTFQGNIIENLTIDCNNNNHISNIIEIIKAINPTYLTLINFPTNADITNITQEFGKTKAITFKTIDGTFTVKGDELISFESNGNEIINIPIGIKKN